MRAVFITLALVMPSVAQAQVFECFILQHWRNAALNGEYVPDAPEVSDVTRAVVLDFKTGAVSMGKGQPIYGKTVHEQGANSIGILTGGTREIAIHAIFPHIKDPQGRALGSIIRINDNDYMPRGTLMSRLSCKQR